MGPPNAYQCPTQTDFSLSDFKNPSQWSLLVFSISTAYTFLAALCLSFTGSPGSILLLYALHIILCTSSLLTVSMGDHYHFLWGSVPPFSMLTSITSDITCISILTHS